MYESSDFFTLSAKESRGAWGTLAVWAGWLALLALIVVTGVHAVSLVISQTGVDAGMMAAIRIGSPVLTEVVAAIVAIGFAAHVWRGTQRLMGMLVEVLWLLFAALNLVTSFTLESGGSLAGLFAYWLHYGLPLSALAAGGLFYVLLRSDPEHKRQSELKATAEAHTMAEFAARREVMLSPQMAAVLRQRGWLAVVSSLERQGYTQQQIGFMLSAVPELQALTGGQAALPAGGDDDEEEFDLDGLVNYLVEKGMRERLAQERKVAGQ